MKYDIFISYRRKGGYETAKHLYDLLTRDGYTVSFDIDTLRNGDFDTALLQRIEECTDFILILNKGAFDRTLDPSFNPKNDWMRNELAHALKHNKNIIPVMLEGFDAFPEDLPDDICKVVRKNGPKYDSYYFDDFYRKMKKSFFETPEPILHDQQSTINKSSIKFKSNISCDYYIDGEYQERIDEDTLHQISLPQGEYFFEFVSAYNAGVDKDSRKIKLAGEDIAFEIDLNSIAEHREALEQEAKKAIETKYNSHNDFCGGLCLVQRNGLYGYLNVKLEEVIPFIYEDAEDFESYCGTALVKRYGKYGTIDLKGKIRIPLEYDQLSGEKYLDRTVESDYIRCSKDGKCGVLDQWGEIRLPIEYESLGDILADHCITISDKKAGLYDLKNGKQVLPPVHEKLILTDIHAIFYKDGHCGLYFLDGSLTTKARYDEILPFSEELAAVRIGKLWGFIDKSDKLVISPRFDECKAFTCGVAAVRKGDKWGYIDHSGKEVIAYKYDEAGPMLAGAAIVKSGDTAGVIDRSAHQIYPMTKGAEMRQSSLAYSYQDQAFPVLALLPDNSLELISPQGKVYKLAKEHYYTMSEGDMSIIFLTFNDTEHMFTSTHEEEAEQNVTRYDAEDILSLVMLFEADTENAKSEESKSEIYSTIQQIVVEYFEKDAATIGPDTNLRTELGADDDDITDIMMRIEEELAVLVDSESYFRSLDTIQEIADYISALVAADDDDEAAVADEDGDSPAAPAEASPAPTPQPEPAPAPAPQPKYKRGDIYVHNGVESVIVSYNETTHQLKLATKQVKKSYWEDPSFGGLAKKLGSKASNMNPDDYPDGCFNSRLMMAVKNWEEKYPALWICSEYGANWFLPSFADLSKDFAAPEVQAHYEKDTCYWTSNTHHKDQSQAFVASPRGMAFCADRKHMYPVVAMCYVRIY